MRTLAIMSAMIITFVFMVATFSENDKELPIQHPIVGVMTMPTVTVAPTSAPTVTPTSAPTVLPMATPTVHLYCAGKVLYCQTGWCADLCGERVYTESHELQ